nr:ABC transporter permease subunit [Pantoea sp. Ap-967]
MASVTILTVGFVAMYIPIALMFAFSFNESKLVTLWSGFSFHWYTEVVKDGEIISALIYSLKLAFITACCSTAVGVWVGFVLARYEFRGRSLLGVMVNAPIVMPEVIMGLALLLLFVTMKQFFGIFGDRGALTVLIGHIILAVAYVGILVQARLREMDLSLEEAALDLGARPLKIFFVITLPLISASLISGWLLSFTLSMDNLIITSFLTGPDSVTLPMVIFSRARQGLSPEINALATLLLACITIIVVIANSLIMRNERRKLVSSFS